MASTSRQAVPKARVGRVFFLPALMLAGLGNGRAEAQFGIGFGFDLGYRTPASVEYLNQRSQISAANAATNRQNATPNLSNLSANPNSYLNRRREAAVQERFSVDSRMGLEGRVSSFGAMDTRPRNVRQNPLTGEFERVGGAAAATPQPTQVADASITPLDRFFNTYDELVWPADAPYEDDFKPLRETSDSASLATLKEVRTNGLASVTTASHARETLLDYGRPALQHVRATSTSQVADTFHGFLLSLYRSLENSAKATRAQTNR